ncbi:hypothetical protein ZIOFF_074646 [Zingiber officinale]|uniref:GIY-YIG domain-containing protein n=2 Tax=Zingiber officinale TaxID=94328 RepID=A0A8J5BY73_ZINOF|nr:hypothetical protein ZIOFF_074646 [Zingiber officinale]
MQISRDVQIRLGSGVVPFNSTGAMRPLASVFRSVKNCRRNRTSAADHHGKSTPESRHHSRNGGGGARLKRGRKAGDWEVYLIVSSRLPKTYVGVTTDFSRRLKQHNGILKGGAKACSGGRPWSLACIIRGFKDRSEACEFESRWKIASRKMPRKKKELCAANPVLEHRQTALDHVRRWFDWSSLQIEWKANSS